MDKDRFKGRFLIGLIGFASAIAALTLLGRRNRSAPRPTTSPNEVNDENPPISPAEKHVEPPTEKIRPEPTKPTKQPSEDVRKQVVKILGEQRRVAQKRPPAAATKPTRSELPEAPFIASLHNHFTATFTEFRYVAQYEDQDWIRECLNTSYRTKGFTFAEASIEYSSKKRTGRVAMRAHSKENQFLLVLILGGTADPVDRHDVAMYLGVGDYREPLRAFPRMAKEAILNADDLAKVLREEIRTITC